MVDFDIILGMSLLSPYHFVLNYNPKSVTLETLGREIREGRGVKS